MGVNEQDSVDHDRDFSRLFGDLLDDVGDLVSAKQKRDSVRDSCDGNWGYFGHDEESKLDKASSKVESRLKAMIDSRIAAFLSNQHIKEE